MSLHYQASRPDVVLSAPWNFGFTTVRVARPPFGVVTGLGLYDGSRLVLTCWYQDFFLPFDTERAAEWHNKIGLAVAENLAPLVFGMGEHVSMDM
jgi:hypothetical protein